MRRAKGFGKRGEILYVRWQVLEKIKLLVMSKNQRVKVISNHIV